MIEKILNKYGYVEAYLEYYQLDENAHFDQAGKCLFVNDMWVHGSKRNKSRYYADYFIQKIIPLYPGAKHLYWVRHKYRNRKSTFIIRRGTKIKLIKEK